MMNKKMEQLKKCLDLILNTFEDYNENGFSVYMSGDDLLHNKVNKSKFYMEYELPKKNNWETIYEFEDGDWLVFIHHLNQNQLMELVELFDEYIITLNHSHTIVDELLEELFERYRDDNLNIIEWKKFLSDYVKNGFKVKYFG